MNFLLGTLIVSASVSLALKTPGSIHRFKRIGQVPANVSGISVLDEAIKHAPEFVEGAMALEHFMSGSHKVFDVLHESTRTPRSINSFLELERKIDMAVEKTRALAEIKNIVEFGAKRLHEIKGFGLDSINIGLARSGAPWYSLMKSLASDESNFDAFDNSDVQLVGDVAFFLNMAYAGEFKHKWRICFAAGLYAQFYFKGRFYSEGLVGSEFGGEDLYFAFAKTGNVPGWSWSMAFNHDYVTRFVGDKHELQRQRKFQEISHQYSHLSRLSGGFEFAAGGKLSELVAINFGYCIMGRSQGGDCVDRLETDTKAEKEKENGVLQLEEAMHETDNAPELSMLAKLPNAPSSRVRKGAARSACTEDGDCAEDEERYTMEDVLNAEKWSKNTVSTGVGHCWCNTDDDGNYWKKDWEWGQF